MWALPLSLSHTCRARGERNLVFSAGLVLARGAAVVGKRATVSALGTSILGKGVGDGGRRKSHLNEGRK